MIVEPQLIATHPLPLAGSVSDLAPPSKRHRQRSTAPLHASDQSSGWIQTKIGILPTKICQHIHMALTSEHLNLTSQETHQTGIQQKKQSGI